MCSTNNEGESVVAERFIRALKNEIYKQMTAIPKNVYFDVLDDIVDKYNNTYHRTIKMKPKDVKSDYFAEHDEEYGDHVRITKYKIFLQKFILQTVVKKSLLLKK